DPRISSRPAAVRPIIREAGHMRAASRVQKDQKKGLTEGVSTYVFACLFGKTGFHFSLTNSKKRIKRPGYEPLKSESIKDNGLSAL
ncbi:hypothetical protein, partial [Agrobacterium vitis]|uniref:hypothetical protein n=1 Tax=Agrobacterium vitis TaxID=373 RepID=UPI001AEE3E7B